MASTEVQVVPAPARASSAGTLAALIADAAARQPHAPAVLAPGRPPLCYGDLYRLSAATGDRLRELGAGSTDRLAVVLPNGPEMAAFALAVGSHTACAPLNPRYRRQEFEFYLSDLRAAALVLPPGGSAEAEAAANGLGIPVLRAIADPGLPAGTFHLEGATIKDAPAPDAASAETVALLLHTSGTTSRPKLVPLTHANLYTSAHNVADSLALTPADRCLNIMPLFHIHGIVAALLATVASGGSIVCTDGVYAGSFFGWLEEFRPTWYTAVPTMHQSILARGRDAYGDRIGSTLRFIRSCSAALAPATLADLEAFFGVPVVEAYGMTEAAHQMTCNPLPPRPRKPGSVGIPAGPEIAVLDGEVVIRGANVTSGYERNDAANADAYRDGWFRTGDLGSLDEDGYLYVLGRIKEQINRGGEKISPREIDEVLLEHPAVAQALAFAVPHRQLGEEVGAAVVLKPGASIGERELRSFAAAHLADFKVPRVVRFVEDIPKGPTGKLQRIGLAAALAIEPLDDTAATAEYVAPRDATEQRIAAIWCELLGKERVGVKDRFSTLGGDSLLAVKMTAAIGAAFATDAPFTEFLEEGTIESLARAIAAPPAPAALRLLTEPRAGAPVICAPGHDGVLIGLKRLADLLEPRRPVYAMNYEGADTIEGLAATAVASLDATAVPPVLVGVCFGGYVALEAARFLKTERGIVVPVALVDCTNPRWRTSASVSEYMRALVRQLRIKYPYHLQRFVGLGPVEGLRYMADRARAYFAYHRGMRRARRSSAPSGGPAALRAAGVAYHPGEWDGPVLLLHTRGRRIEYPGMGWRHAFAGVVREVELPFAPLGAVSDELVRQTAAAISEFVSAEAS